MDASLAVAAAEDLIMSPKRPTLSVQAPQSPGHLSNEWEAKTSQMPEVGIHSPTDQDLAMYASPARAARTREFGTFKSQPEGQPSRLSKSDETSQTETEPIIPRDARDMQEFALPVGVSAPYIAPGDIGQGWQQIEHSDAPLMSSLQAHWEEAKRVVKPKLKAAKSVVFEKAQQAREKAQEFWELDGTQSMISDLNSSARTIGDKYKASLACLGGQFQALPLGVKLWTIVLLFLHLIVPLGFLALPEARACFKYACLSYLMCHGLIHFTNVRLGEAIAWSHAVWVPLLLELVVTPGSESFVLGHPGWSYVISNVHPGDMQLYLIWLRLTIAFTFTTLCHDAVLLNRLAAEEAVATGVGVGVGAGVGVGGAPVASQAPTQQSTISLPSKVQLVVDVPQTSIKQTMPRPYSQVVKTEELKQPERLAAQDQH